MSNAIRCYRDKKVATAWSNDENEAVLAKLAVADHRLQTTPHYQL